MNSKKAPDRMFRKVLSDAFLSCQVILKKINTSSLEASCLVFYYNIPKYEEKM